MGHATLEVAPDLTAAHAAAQWTATEMTQAGPHPLASHWYIHQSLLLDSVSSWGLAWILLDMQFTSESWTKKERASVWVLITGKGVTKSEF